jgi:hypothetical protein
LKGENDKKFSNTLNIGKVRADMTYGEVQARPEYARHRETSGNLLETELSDKN